MHVRVRVRVDGNLYMPSNALITIFFLTHFESRCQECLSFFVSKLVKMKYQELIFQPCYHLFKVVLEHLKEKSEEKWNLKLLKACFSFVFVA